MNRINLVKEILKALNKSSVLKSLNILADAFDYVCLTEEGYDNFDFVHFQYFDDKLDFGFSRLFTLYFEEDMIVVNYIEDNEVATAMFDLSEIKNAIKFMEKNIEIVKVAEIKVIVNNNIEKFKIVESIIKELNKNRFIKHRNIYANNIDLESAKNNSYNFENTEQFLYNHEDNNFSAAINIFDYNFETELLEVYDYTEFTENNLKYFNIAEIEEAADFIEKSMKYEELRIYNEQDE